VYNEETGLCLGRRRPVSGRGEETGFRRRKETGLSIRRKETGLGSWNLKSGIWNLESGYWKQ